MQWGKVVIRFLSGLGRYESLGKLTTYFLRVDKTPVEGTMCSRLGMLCDVALKAQELVHGCTGGLRACACIHERLTSLCMFALGGSETCTCSH